MEHFTIIAHDLNSLNSIIDNPDYQDSAHDDLLNFNKAFHYINQEVLDNSSEHWRFWKILDMQHTPPKHKDLVGRDFNVKILWETDLYNDKIHHWFTLK